jgi:hypothetical protein
MTMRTCDGEDDGLIMYIDIVGTPMDSPEFSVTYINCDCGSTFDDEKNDLTWPHRYIRPVTPVRLMNDLPDIAGFL